MFKVTTIDNQAQSVLMLEGSLVGPWLPELQRTWDETRQTHEGATLIVDLTHLTIVSQHGENILFQMMSQGARIVGKSFLAREVLKQLERRRNRQREERNGTSGRASIAVGMVVLLAMTAQFSWASTRGQPHPASEGPATEALDGGITAPAPMSTSRTQEGEVVVADLPFSSLHLSDLLVNYLELTQSQIVTIQVLVGAERQRIEPVLIRLSANRQLLVTATKSGRFDEKLIRKLAIQQSRLMAELIVATSRFQAELYTVLTPEQQQKVDDARVRQDGTSETGR
jgi:Spy/CpxP family protein refolding chaperone